MKDVMIWVDARLSNSLYRCSCSHTWLLGNHSSWASGGKTFSRAVLPWPASAIYTILGYKPQVSSFLISTMEMLRWRWIWVFTGCDGKGRLKHPVEPSMSLNPSFCSSQTCNNSESWWTSWGGRPRLRGSMSHKPLRTSRWAIISKLQPMLCTESLFIICAQLVLDSVVYNMSQMKGRISHFVPGCVWHND